MYSSTSHTLQGAFSVLVLMLFVAGCGNNGSDSKQETVHSHEDEHGHDHHHSEARFGGQMVEVGHTHNPEGLQFYFAEILPLKENTISFHLSVEDEDSNTNSPTITGTEVLAYVSDPEFETTVSREITFELQETNSAAPATLLSATIPEIFVNSQRLSIVIPKLTLGGERLNFTFGVSTADDSLETANSEDPVDETSDAKETTELPDEEQK